MADWLLTNFYNILPTIEAARPVGYLLVFLFAFFESVAFAGLFIPGTFFTVFVGFIAAQGTFSFGWSLVLVVLGAILGDGLSFYLGRHSGRWFSDDHRWLRRSHIDSGQKFFDRHGPKSIFLGRFIGPIRPIIPFVAGLSRMKIFIFLFYNILSAIIWGLTFLGLGFLAGNLSFELTAGLVRRFELGTLFFGLVFALGVTWWSVRRRPEVARAWATFLKLFRFRFLVTNSRRRLNLTLAIILLIVFYHLAISSGLVLSVLTNGVIVTIDNSLLEFFRADANGGGVANLFFNFVTNLGNGWVLIVLALLFGGALVFVNRIQAVAFLLGLFLTEILVYFAKIFVGRGRPPAGLLNEPNFSFPSGHAAAALFFYGFLAFLVWRYLKNRHWRWAALIFLPALILLIGYSRLYLGVHFFSDVVGGYILGATTLLLTLAFSG